MAKAARHVLKAAEVSLDEPFPLSLDPAAMADCSAARAPSTAAGARIVQSRPEYVVIEVTCSCGKTTQIRCDYAQTQQLEK
jgi:UDP-N-acetylmuramyl pentapeptide synthase